VLGLPALIAPGALPKAFTRDYGVMLLVSLIFAVLCWRRQQQPVAGARCWSAVLWFGWRCCTGQRRSSLNDSG
jgi:cation:H+ antiporter